MDHSGLSSRAEAYPRRAEAYHRMSGSAQSGLDPIEPRFSWSCSFSQLEIHIIGTASRTVDLWILPAKYSGIFQFLTHLCPR